LSLTDLRDAPFMVWTTQCSCLIRLLNSPLSASRFTLLNSAITWLKIYVWGQIGKYFIGVNKWFFLGGTTNCCGTVWSVAGSPVLRSFPLHLSSGVRIFGRAVGSSCRFQIWGMVLILKEMISVVVDFASWHKIYWGCRRNLTSFRDEENCQNISKLHLLTLKHEWSLRNLSFILCLWYRRLKRIGSSTL
jgi:hypothetical protein